MKKHLAIFILMVFISSVYVVQAQENNIKVVSKIIGINSTYNKEIVVVNITMNNIGNVSYAEGYYSVNDSGKLRLDGTSRIVTKNGTDTLTVKVLRPMSPSGKPYNMVKAVVVEDGNVVFKGFYDLNNVSSNADNNNTKKSPGFGTIISIVPIMLIVYLLKMKKT